MVNCYSELENMGKILFSRNRRRSSSQVRVAALSEGGLKSQSGCSLQNPRLGAERRVALDALTNSLQVGGTDQGFGVGLEHEDGDTGAGIEQGFGLPSSDGSQAGPRLLLGALHQSSPQWVSLVRDGVRLCSDPTLLKA